LCGKVKSAVDNKVVPGAIVEFKESKKKSDDKGEFCFEDAVTLVNKKPKEVTLKATKEGWYDEEQTLEVSESTDKVIVEMSPKVKPGEWRFVMTWETKPLDLDAITKFGLDGPASGSDSGCEVDYNAKNKDITCKSNGIKGRLDLDHCWEGATCPDASKEGKPETTTIDVKNCDGDCTVSFKVNNYSAENKYDKATLAESKAVVRVYNSANQEAVATYNIEKDGKVDGYNWYVCSVDTTAVPPKVTPCSSKSQCGF